jgi:hypothetical protein
VFELILRPVGLANIAVVIPSSVAV